MLSASGRPAVTLKAARSLRNFADGIAGSAADTAAITADRYLSSESGTSADWKKNNWDIPFVTYFGITQLRSRGACAAIGIALQPIRKRVRVALKADSRKADTH
jgi:hypothetical protein